MSSSNTKNPPMMSKYEATKTLYPNGESGGFLDCPPRPPSKGSDQDANIIAMGKALDAKTCSAKGKNEQSASAQFGFYLVALHTEASETVVSESSSFGCENIALVNQIQETTTSNIACIIQNAISNFDVQLMSDMRISFSNSDISIDGDFDLNQTSDMKVVSKISINASQVSSIVHQLAASASMIHSVVQAAVSENAGVVPSNKTVNNAVACSDVNNFTKQVNNVISNLRISVNANKSISFSGVKMAIKGNFKLSQNAIFDLTAEAIVTAAMSNVMNTSAAIVSDLSSSTNQKTEATNPATVGVSGWLTTLKSAVIPIVILVVVLGVLGVITALIRMKGSSTTQPQVPSKSVIPSRMQSVLPPSQIQQGIPSATRQIQQRMQSSTNQQQGIKSVIPSATSQLQQEIKSVIPSATSQLQQGSKSVIPSSTSQLQGIKSVIPSATGQLQQGSKSATSKSVIPSAATSQIQNVLQSLSTQVPSKSGGSHSLKVGKSPNLFGQTASKPKTGLFQMFKNIATKVGNVATTVKRRR